MTRPDLGGIEFLGLPVAVTFEGDEVIFHARAALELRLRVPCFEPPPRRRWDGLLARFGYRRPLVKASREERATLMAGDSYAVTREIRVLVRSDP